MAFNRFSSKPSQRLQKAEGTSQRPGCGAKVVRHGVVAASAQRFANPEGLGSLRAVPQHRQEIQADQMRNSPLVRTCRFVSESPAEHARGCQLRREPALDQRAARRGRLLGK